MGVPSYEIYSTKHHRMCFLKAGWFAEKGRGTELWIHQRGVGREAGNVTPGLQS